MEEQKKMWCEPGCRWPSVYLPSPEASNPQEISSALGRRGTFLDLAKLALIKLILWGDAAFSM